MSTVATDNALLLDDKIKLAENIITKEYEQNNGSIYLSYSGGKDSSILRDIALRLFPNIRVVFSDTTNELSEVKHYVRKTPDVITVVPDMNFKQVVQKKGFPLVSKEVSQKVYELKNTNGSKTRLKRLYGDVKNSGKLSNKWHYLAEQEFNVTHKCCQILKKDPLEKWAKNNGNPKPIIALMKDESKLRQQLALYGKEDGKKIYPFLRSGWTEADIWEYAKRYNIRFAECYYDRFVNDVLIKARTRTGCEYCGFGIMQEKEDRFARSKLTAPKKYKNMMRLENNGVTFEAAISIAKKASIDPLGLYGGLARSVEINEGQKKEVYKFDIVSDVIECPCCKKKGSKTAVKSYGYYSTFKDTINPRTKRQRVIECHYDLWTCIKCGMTLNNHLHMFDLRFSVTKRLVDYICSNIGKKTELELSDETGLNLYDVFEILLCYENYIKNAKENKLASIWFDSNNNLLKVS